MSKIAVLGWGSLIWNPRRLALAGDWHSDGPVLPIEFSRISSGGRLTLVVHEGADPVQVLWAMMDDDDPERARENLRARENCPTKDDIGCVHKDGRRDSDWKFSDTIHYWMQGTDIDCTIWTALPSNFARERSCEFTVENALDYLRTRKGDDRHRAEEYIRKAPLQVRTELRSVVERKFGWFPIEEASLGKIE